MPRPPEPLKPMLAQLGKLPADDDRWAYEVKWDGYRALAYATGQGLRLVSRNGNEVTRRYPALQGMREALGGHEALLDGEVVAFDDTGRPSFQQLQRGEGHIAYVAFDILWLDGSERMELPYEERRALLAQTLPAGSHWQVPAHHAGGGAALLAAAREQGLEGILAKRLGSTYEPGKRNGAWVKIKNTARQELVIGGWFPGEGRRTNHIGALLMGYYDDGEFRLAGKVGTGFGQAELERLAGLLAPLETDASPFDGRQPRKGAHFVEPVLVAEIEFTEWTTDGMLRHPSYKGLRDDKRAADVVRETPA
ncbi:MAG: non-homologous end-joining DNA ligase [Solirubrobacteraceae bacterium]